MISLKTITLNTEEKQKLEAALRRYSNRRYKMLDFEQAASDIGSEKLFLGYDGKKNIQFTRIKSSVEFFLPKIIITLPRKELENTIKLRYALFPFIFIFFIAALGLLVTLTTVFIRHEGFENLLFPALLLAFAFGLTIIELKIVEHKMSKATKLYAL